MSDRKRGISTHLRPACPSSPSNKKDVHQRTMQTRTARGRSRSCVGEPHRLPLFSAHSGSETNCGRFQADLPNSKMRVHMIYLFKKSALSSDVLAISLNRPERFWDAALSLLRWNQMKEHESLRPHRFSGIEFGRRSPTPGTESGFWAVEKEQHSRFCVRLEYDLDQSFNRGQFRIVSIAPP
jgi:hypothetical protein